MQNRGWVEAKTVGRVSILGSQFWYWCGSKLAFQRFSKVKCETALRPSSCVGLGVSSGLGVSVCFNSSSLVVTVAVWGVGVCWCWHVPVWCAFAVTAEQPAEQASASVLVDWVESRSAVKVNRMDQEHRVANASAQR